VVECNHDEERLARIEQMVEELQRESDARKTVGAPQSIIMLVDFVPYFARKTRRTKRASA